MLVSRELITNALAAARRLVADGERPSWDDQDEPIRLGILATDSWTLLSVRDPDPRPMTRKDPEEELSEFGRGLTIIEGLSLATWTDYEPSGKTRNAIVSALDDIEGPPR